MTSLEKAEKIVASGGACVDVSCDVGKQNECPAVKYCNKTSSDAVRKDEYIVAVCDIYIKKQKESVKDDKQIKETLKGFKIDLSWVKGEARAVLINAIINKICKKYGAITSTLSNVDMCNYLFFNLSERTLTAESCKGVFNSHTFTEVSVNNALLGKFPENKKEGIIYGYKVSLLKYEGVEREIISTAIQKEAIRLGFSSYCEPNTILYTDEPYLYFDIKGKLITYGSYEYTFKEKPFKELSALEVFSDKMPKVN
jgi:hypothetical protein